MSDSESRRVLIASDKFKGTLSAIEVCAALATGFEAEGWSADRCPLADGGEGTAAALIEARGGELFQARAHDPLGRPIDSSFAVLADGLAVVEVAAASGIALLAKAELDPLESSTAGTGELIVEAAKRAETVLVAVGGSATTDGGLGAVRAIADAGGIGDVQLVCLCDVSTPWEQAASTFGPQKGAGPEQVAALEKRMDDLAETLEKDPRGLIMSGAAGGLAGGLWAALDATLIAGAGFVLDAVSFNSRAAGADLVITGEGRLDETTLQGKLVAEVSRRCALLGVPVHAAVGEDALAAEGREALGLAAVHEAGTPARLEGLAASLG
ncbi:glycerate kinase [soil metagenome]